MMKSIRSSAPLFQLLSLGAASLLAGCVVAPEPDTTKPGTVVTTPDDSSDTGSNDPVDDSDDPMTDGSDDTADTGPDDVDGSDDGWTNLKPSADTVKIFVSSSSGDDANDGTAPEKAVKTLKKGASLLTSGQPDWLLLKRGDAWVNETLYTEATGVDESKNGVWNKSGRSASEPLVISYYGDMKQPRPRLKTGRKAAIFTAKDDTVNHLAIVGVRFSAHTRDKSQPEFQAARGYSGINWQSKTDGLLIEDVFVDHYKDAIIMQAPSQDAIQNVTIRRSLLVDSYQLETTPEPFNHSQGIYADYVKNLSIEENVLDHNGWADGIEHAHKTQYNHNIYIQVTCKDLKVERNILTRGSGHGLQARPGGLVTDNLFAQNPLALSFGLVRGTKDPLPGGVTGEVSGNVILEGNDISADLRRGFGMEIANIKSAAVFDNIIANNASTSKYGYAIQFDTDQDAGIYNLVVENNIIHNWASGLYFGDFKFENMAFQGNVIAGPSLDVFLLKAPGGLSSGVTFANNTWATETSKWFEIDGAQVSFSQWKSTREPSAKQEKVAFVDPSRSLGSYSKSLGKEETFEGFIAETRHQKRGNFRDQYTAQAAIDYIRKGFEAP